jgi:SAM-dependent methyltransferase
MDLSTYRQGWEDLARLDPLWAILVEPSKRLGRWDPREFFRTGEEEVHAVMQRAAELNYPALNETALDFGCGVGRLTRALAGYFKKSYGVDISERMVEQARELNRSIPNVEFVPNARQDLTIFDDQSMDMIYTGRVLQHLPDRAAISSYLSEFVRILKKGGLIVCQIPTQLPVRDKLQPRRRLYSLLGGMGFSSDFLYKRFALYPIRMIAVPQSQVLQLLTSRGARVLAADENNYAGPRIRSVAYYATKD